MYGGTITWAALCNILIYSSYSMGWYTLHSLWGGTLWSGIMYILYGLVYITYSMGWYTIHTL